ncbi:MAG TPA: ATP-binding protein [Kiritimatiellia bacterium]|nr:ATP-binding protein [Kiritimatiellia bacterium]
MDKRDTELTDRVREIARKAQVWCESKGKSQAWLVRKYDTLGSARTLRDMRDGKFDGYDIEQQAANYEAALAMIEADDPASKAVRVIAALTGPVQLRRAVLEARTATGIDRVILLLGDSGTGKTCSLQALRDEYDSVALTEALEVWGDSPGAMLCDILEALGEQASPASPAYSLFRRAVVRLGQRRTTLCVDEAHQMGPRCLNTLKGLVNATPGEFVLAGQPLLWAKLQSAAHLELRQIVTNRLRERITLGLNANDVAAYIRAVFPALDRPACEAAAKAVCGRAANLGNMSFVRDCCAAAARKAEEPTRPEAGDWAKAAEATAAKK